MHAAVAGEQRDRYLLRDDATMRNGTIGYGSTTDTGNTINVVAGATVYGTTSGITLNQGTINNGGLIVGGTAATNGRNGHSRLGDLQSDGHQDRNYRQ